MGVVVVVAAGLGKKFLCQLGNFRGTYKLFVYLNNKKNKNPKPCLFYSPQRADED